MLHRLIPLALTALALASPAAAQTAPLLEGAVYVVARTPEKLVLLVTPRNTSGESKMATVVQVFSPPRATPAGQPLHRLDVSKEFDCGLMRSRNLTYAQRTETGAAMGSDTFDSPEWKAELPDTIGYLGMQIVCSQAFVSSERGDVASVIAAWKAR